MAKRKHPHEGRIAEVYRRRLDGDLIWDGYAAEPVPGADWSEELQAWVISE